MNGLFTLLLGGDFIMVKKGDHINQSFQNQKGFIHQLFGLAT